MNRIILLLIAGSLTLSCTNSNPFYLKSDWDKEGLKGDVSSVVTHSIRVNKRGEVDTVSTLHTIYNHDGFTDSTSYHAAYNNDTNYKKYYYSSRNTLDSIIGGNGKELVRVHLIYNKGVLKQQKEEYLGTARVNIHDTKFVYDRLSNKLKKRVYRAYTIKKQDTLKNFYKTTYYNNRGQIDYNENIYFKRKKNQRVLVKHLRDAQGLIRERMEYNKDDELIFSRKYVYTYDEHDNWVEMKTFLNGVLKGGKRREITYF